MGSMGSLTKRMDTVEEAMKKMNYTYLDLEAKSFRSNLLVHGISKMDDEDVVETTHLFVSETLALDGTDEVHSATRLERPGGRQGTLRKPRPILTTFPYERQHPPGKASIVMSVIGPIVEGENPNIDITCSVSDPGYPQATFKWSKDNQDQSGGEDGSITIRQGSARVSKHDAKAHLSQSLPRTLTVVADPKDSFSVTCGFISKPSVTISWTYINNNILPDGVITQPITTTSSGKMSTVTQKLLWNPNQTYHLEDLLEVYLCKGLWT
ncbi:hypothetical protein LSH36_2124g00005 [Paralvinella palmiformis]|uniref:Ig-like domain-containing protein n=1 Tax=Paralvinella palmiformis TaxID=53620 RepID=A0AAD9IRP4_9ANNE|nr:hypothetical protein LSH36_2124g00005 [Paralvinella palmiformis]